MLPADPAHAKGDAHLVFIGRVRSPWTNEAPRPRNPREAREQGGGACLEIDPPFRPALQGLDRFSHVVVHAWLHAARREAPAPRPPPPAAPPRGR
jgi:tRNA (Thr-GGU) A37 N-methylase